MDVGLFDFSEEVRAAREDGKPIVALESTIISHGFPYPANLEMARDVEGIVRSGGAVPATIAVQHGRIKVGLSEAECEFFARADGVAKASRRDLAVLVGRGGSGATTVAATAFIASCVGISSFATGGIGGVHRGGEDNLDISADLNELATSQVIVVCAGAKSILDIGLTLEYLETCGVAVVGYQTDHFPAFYSRESGFAVPTRCDSITELASIFDAQRALDCAGAMLVVNPIPVADEIPRAEMEPIIEAAERERLERNISGSEVTPFLLARIAELSAGKSIRANRALVANNVKLAAEIACSLHMKHA